jgi:hypothetical protein
MINKKHCDVMLLAQQSSVIRKRNNPQCRHG